MTWLFLQVFVYCLVSFLLGALLTWFFVVRLRSGSDVAPDEAACGVPGKAASGVPGEGAVEAVFGKVAGDTNGVDPVPSASEPEIDLLAGSEAAPSAGPVTGAPDAEATPAESVAEPVVGLAAARSLPGTSATEHLQVATAATAVVEPRPYGEGSATALPDGSAPSDDYTIKGNAQSMLYHTRRGPYFGRTKADVWFRTESDAERDGFTAWDQRRDR